MTSFFPVIRNLPNGQLDADALINSVTPEQLAWWVSKRLNGKDPFLFGGRADDYAFPWTFFVNLIDLLRKNQNPKVSYFDFVADFVLSEVILSGKYDSEYANNVRDFLLYSHIQSIKQKLVSFVTTTKNVPWIWVSAISQYGSKENKDFWVNLKTEMFPISLYAFCVDDPNSFIESLEKAYIILIQNSGRNSGTVTSKDIADVIFSSHFLRFIRRHSVEGRSLLEKVALETKNYDLACLINNFLKKRSLH